MEKAEKRKDQGKEGKEGAAVVPLRAAVGSGRPMMAKLVRTCEKVESGRPVFYMVKSVLSEVPNPSYCQRVS